jgi:hypothetical protein
MRAGCQAGTPVTVVAVALWLATPPAFAFDTMKIGQFGSLGVDELTAVIDQAPKLKREVAEALAKLGKKPEEIRCSGVRFPGAWVGLAGERVSPYVCPFGERWLEIRTKVRISGKHGKVYVQISPEAMRRADNVTESDPTWTWSDKKPASAWP